MHHSCDQVHCGVSLTQGLPLSHHKSKFVYHVSDLVHKVVKLVEKWLTKFHLLFNQILLEEILQRSESEIIKLDSRVIKSIFLSDLKRSRSILQSIFIL